MKILYTEKKATANWTRACKRKTRPATSGTLGFRACDRFAVPAHHGSAGVSARALPANKASTSTPRSIVTGFCRDASTSNNVKHRPRGQRRSARQRHRHISFLPQNAATGGTTATGSSHSTC